MSMLLCIDVRTKQILHPEVIKLVPSFELLSHEELIAVALYCDYNSIYKQFPDHERKRRAMFHAFDDNVPGFFDKKLIKEAIQDYTSLQYNPKIELANKFQKKIDDLTSTMDIDTSATSIKKTLDAISSLRQSIRALNDEVHEQVLNDGVLKGGMQLSYLERIMANRKLFLSITAKK